MTGLLAGREVRREGLLHRVERVQPRLIALIAPAGFGKSTLARQLIAGERSAVCDATGVADELDLARRLLPALAAERPDLTQALTQRELMLGDTHTSVDERLSVALEAWREESDGTFFVFENAEHIARQASAREFFAALLSQCPRGRTLVICSRENLRIHLTRFAAPHEILVLRARDLAFDKIELAALFGRYGSHPGFLTRIMQASQGWPIAVFLLKRFANEGRIEELLETLSDVAFEELHDYLADQVLAELDPDLIGALFSCACVPRATIADLQPTNGERAIAELITFARESPFLTRNAEGEFLLHPLLASLLLERRGEQRDQVLAASARAHELAQRYQRAAELHLARGDQPAAARALGQHEVIRDHTPSMPYARILASLDRSLVQRYPRLWAVTALLRTFCVDTEELMDEAESLWRTLSTQCPPIERYYILMFRVLLMTDIGLLHEASQILEDFSAQHAGSEKVNNAFDAHICYLRGLMLARQGRLTRAERDLTAALPLVSTMDIMGSGTYLALGADIARVRGKFALARQFVERALEGARASGLQNFVALDLAEAAFGAWLSGDDALASRYAAELDETVQRNAVRGFAYFAAVMRGRSETPQDTDMLKWVACGRMIEAVNAADQPEAMIAHARAAVAAARQYATPFIEALAHIVLAYADSVQFDDHLRRAVDLSEQCESPAFVAAAYAIANRDADRGMLTALVHRITRSHVERVPALEVRLCGGEVFAKGREVSLSDREFALLIALALRREAVPRARLADLLWPELDSYAARNALSVCLHRLRQHIGGEEVIVRAGDGYALASTVNVDLWDIDRTVSVLRTRAVLSPSERRTLAEIFAILCKRRPARMLQWEWFEPTERHLNEFRLEIAARLGKEALAERDWQRALAVAEEVIAYDPCDEAARQIAITAHLATGDRGAALRQYRRYREALAEELQAEPSLEIRQLVGLR